MKTTSKLEMRIANGDRDAMAHFLAESLREDLSNAELERRYYVEYDADHGGVLR